MSVKTAVAPAHRMSHQDDSYDYTWGPKLQPNNQREANQIYQIIGAPPQNLLAEVGMHCGTCIGVPAVVR